MSSSGDALRVLVIVGACGAAIALALVCGAAAFVGTVAPRVDTRTEPEVTVDAAEQSFAAWRAREPEPVSTRTVTVTIAADEEYRRRADWEGDARALVQAGSEIFERAFGIVFEVTHVAEWGSPAGASDVVALYEAALPLVDDRSELFVALYGQRRVDTVPAERYYARGFAPYFGRLLIMRPNHVGKNWPYDRETIAHEFGHLFGAWHARRSSCLMRRDKEADERYDFGPVARQVIERTKALDLKRGLDGVDAGTETFLTALWRRRPGVGEDHPVGYTLAMRAHRRMLSGMPYSDLAPDVERAGVLFDPDRGPATASAKQWMEALRAHERAGR